MHRSVMKWEIIIMGGKGEFNLDEMEDGEIWINSSEQAGGENFCCSSELEHIKVDYKIRALFIFYFFLLSHIIYYAHAFMSSFLNAK